jgi:hypothetical protein
VWKSFFVRVNHKHRKEFPVRFDSSRIKGLFSNEKDRVGNTIRDIHHSEKIVVAQGFGIKEDGVPLRFLAYIVPVLNLMKQLPESATAEFYVAHHGVIRVNGFHVDRTAPHISMMRDAVIRYSSTVHPEESRRVRFIEDRSIEDDLPTRDLIASLAEVVKPLCRQNERIWKFVEDRDGATSLNYIVEHALYMRDPLQGINPEHWLVPGMVTDMQHVIMIGGSSEKIFHDVRQLLCQAVGTHSRWKSHQFFTSVGGRPPTYHPQPGEPLWTDRESLPGDVRGLLHSAYRDVSNERGERKEVTRDLLAILLDAGHVSSFAELKPSLAKTVAEGGEIPSEIQTTLQQGWDTLRFL